MCVGEAGAGGGMVLVVGERVREETGVFCGLYVLGFGFVGAGYGDNFMSHDQIAETTAGVSSGSLFADNVRTFHLRGPLPFNLHGPRQYLATFKRTRSRERWAHFSYNKAEVAHSQAAARTMAVGRPPRRLAVS